MEEWGKISKQKSKWLAKKRTEQACRWGFKSFICEMRLRDYKSTIIDKGLNYSSSVKLLILETIVSQRPCVQPRMPEAKLPWVTNIRAIGHQLAGEQLVVDRKPGCEANNLVVDCDLGQSDQSGLSISS